MRDYRDNDQTVGYCPHCGKTLSGLTEGARGFCEVHGWQWADWKSRDYSRAALDRWAEQHDETEYLRMEQKLDEAGLL